MVDASGSPVRNSSFFLKTFLVYWSVRITNAELKHLRSLGQKKVRQREKKFLVEGWRALREVLNSGVKIDLVAVTERYLGDSDYSGFIDDLNGRKIALREIGDRDLAGIAESVHAQGIVAVVHAPAWDMHAVHGRRPCLIVAVDGVGDPGNLGTLIRSADWFGADAVVLGKGSVELSNDKVIRSTVGSVFHIPVLEGVDIPSYVRARKEQNFSVKVLAADGAESYTEAEYKERTILVVGSEARGVSNDVRAVAEAVMRIPRYGHGESLNVGVAAAIALAHMIQQRPHGPKDRR